MSQCAPGRIKKNLLDLFKSSIPDISTRKLLRNCIYLRACNSIYMYLIKTRLRISQFLKIDDHFYPLLHYLVFSRVYFLIQNVVFTPRKKASAMHGLKMAIKQPTFVSFDFKRSSNDQDGLTPSTLGENTETCSQLIPDVRVPLKQKLSILILMKPLIKNGV